MKIVLGVATAKHIVGLSWFKAIIARASLKDPLPLLKDHRPEGNIGLVRPERSREHHFARLTFLFLKDDEMEAIAKACGARVRHWKYKRIHEFHSTGNFMNIREFVFPPTFLLLHLYLYMEPSLL